MIRIRILLLFLLLLCSCSCCCLKGPRVHVWHGLYVPLDFFHIFFKAVFQMFFLRFLDVVVRSVNDLGSQNDFKNRSKIYNKSIQKWTLKTIPHNVQKSLKSDAPGFEKSMKTIVPSSIFVVFTHVHQIRKSNRKGSKIETQTTPNQ